MSDKYITPIITQSTLISRKKQQKMPSAVKAGGIRLHSENFLRLAHILSYLYAERTSLFTRAALHALTRMMLQQFVMLPHCFGDIFSGLSEIEKFCYGSNIDFHGAGLTVRTIHAMTLPADFRE